MKKFLIDLFTEDDNNTWCIARVSTFMGILSFIGLGISHIVMNHAFEPSEYGMGLGTLLGGAGVLVGAKAATQKEQK